HFLGRGQDFALVRVREEAAAATPPAPVTPKEVEAAWRLRDEWWNEPWLRPSHQLLRAFDVLLLRVERDLQGGVLTAAAVQELQKQLKLLEEKRQEGQDKLPPRPPSLAREIVRGKKPPDLKAGDLREKYRALLALASKIASAKAASKGKETPAGQKAAERL